MRIMHLPILSPGWICVAGLGSLAGCTTEGLRDMTSVPFGTKSHVVVTGQGREDDHPDKLISILNYEQFIHELPEEDLDMERALHETSLDTASAAARVKLALLYAHKDAPFYDPLRAQSILRSCDKNDTGVSVEIRSFIALLDELLSETIDQQSALKASRSELKKEREQTKLLKEQLEALKAIEESINDRTHRMSEIIR